jgi:predicted nucleic acid-binding protein
MRANDVAREVQNLPKSRRLYSAQAPTTSPDLFMTIATAFSTPTLVLDSNVVLDWLVFHNPGVMPVRDAVLSGAVRWIVSADMRAELGAVLGYPALAAWSPDATAVWPLWERWAQPVAALATSGAGSRLRCRDKDDQKFIDLALAHGARWLLSRDKAVLALARRAAPLGLQICTPEHWCAPGTEQTARP